MLMNIENFMSALSDMKFEISPLEYEKCLNYDDAKLYCELLIIDAKNDWRLPTFPECKIISGELMARTLSQTIQNTEYWVTGDEYNFHNLGGICDILYPFMIGYDLNFKKNIVCPIRDIHED